MSKPQVLLRNTGDELAVPPADKSSIEIGIEID
jgi:hypothetical protein